MSAPRGSHRRSQARHRDGSRALLLDIFGSATIRVPDGSWIVASKSPVAFGLLFRLALDPGAPLPRARIIELLYDDDTKATRLRFNTLLASQRRRGVRFLITDDGVGLAADAVEWRPAHAGLLFGGWVGAVSATYEAWFANERRRIVLRYLTEPLASLNAAREYARWSEVAEHSRRILDLDPLNEAAHAAMVEALMFTSSKVAAIEYLAFAEQTIGEHSVFARQPLAALRERILGAQSPSDSAMRDAPLYARAGLLEHIGRVAAHVRANSAVAGIAMTGPAGVGKSTMWNAALAQLEVLGWTSVRTRCLETEREFPLGLVFRMVPALLAAPGAGGAAPEMYGLLRDVSGGARPLRGSVRDHQRHVATALVEVINAIACEGPLVVGIDDTHWLDSASRALLREVIELVPNGAVLWVFAECRSPYRWPRSFTSIPVGGLTPADSEDLLRRSLGTRSHTDLPGSVRRALEATGGNPLWIRSVALGVQRGGSPDAPGGGPALDAAETLVEEARRLPTEVQDLLRYVALLGPLATMSRLSALYRRRRRTLLDGLGTAEGLGLLHASKTLGALTIHDLWASAVQRELSPLQARLVHTELLELLLSEHPRDHESTAHLWGIMQCARAAGTPGRAAASASALIGKWLAAGVDSTALQSLFDIIDADDVAPDALVTLTEQLTMYLSTTYQHDLLLGMSRRLTDRLARAGVRSPLFEVFLTITRWTEALDKPDPKLWPVIDAFVRDASRSETSRLAMVHAGLRLRSNDPHGSSMPLGEWRRVLDALTAESETVRAREARLIACTEQLDAPGMRAAADELVRFCDAYARGTSSVERIRARLWAAFAARVLGDYRTGLSLSHEALELALATGAWSPAILVLDATVGALGDTGHWHEAAAVWRALNGLAGYVGFDRKVEKNYSSNGWEVGIAVRLALGDVEGARTALERLVPLTDPGVLTSYMLRPKAGLQGMAATIVALSNLPTAPWRAALGATLIEYADVIRSVQLAHIQGNLFRLAVGGAALGLVDETRELLDALLAHLGAVQWSFPFEAFRELVGAPASEIVQFAFRGRAVASMMEVYSIDRLPAIFTRPVESLSSASSSGPARSGLP